MKLDRCRNFSDPLKSAFVFWPQNHDGGQKTLNQYINRHLSSAMSKTLQIDTVTWKSRLRFQAKTNGCGLFPEAYGFRVNVHWNVHSVKLIQSWFNLVVYLGRSTMHAIWLSTAKIDIYFLGKIFLITTYVDTSGASGYRDILSIIIYFPMEIIDLQLSCGNTLQEEADHVQNFINEIWVYIFGIYVNYMVPVRKGISSSLRQP